MATPLEVVQQVYTFPFDSFFPEQVETINDLGALQKSGHWLDVGVGKTFTSTACALYHHIIEGSATVVIMPPVLIRQWARWLAKIKPSPSVVEWRGTPTERRKLSLDRQFVLVGIQMFKKDYERFTEFFKDRSYAVIIDEANALANIDSDQHEKVYEFSVGHPAILLTGTPVGNPMHVYGLTKFTAPGVYRNFIQFCALHVEERDFFNNPSKFCNLDVLGENIMKNAKRFLFSDVYRDVDEPLFIPINYDLEPKHLALYRKLASEQLLKLPEGGKIDATTAGKLLHALGQIVVNHSHFSGDDKDTSAAVDVVQETLDELGDGKVIVFSFYRLTTALLCKHFKKYGAVAIAGDVGPKQKDKNRDRFVDDPKCQLIVIQFASGGFGLDGLQHVCNDALFIEPCQQPSVFAQCVGRLKRTGQTKRVRIRCAIAEGTLHVRQFKALLDKDQVVNQIIRNGTDLRDMIYGN